jgi:hypothetical protein
MSKSMAFVVCVLLISHVSCFAVPPEKVPSHYSQLYFYLDRILEDQISKSADKQGSEEYFKPILSVDLLVVNSNRGPVLLRSDTLTAVRAFLDRFRSMGVQCVKFALHYPLLRPDFPNASAYLTFYKEVVKEAHLRGIKVMPHVTVMFSNTPFSPFKDLYQGLTLERFKKEFRDMVHLVVRELEPDYLGMLSEPDTHARLTGLDELNNPKTILDVVKVVLKDLERGKTLIGAGSGSWSTLDFARILADQTDLDFISIHIYPINGPMLPNAREMARIAHSRGKKAIIDESWLYKVIRPGGGNNVAATAGIFRRDIYSFWQPLDIKFMKMVLQMAKEEEICLVSFFWSGCFFSYLNYSQELENLPYRDLIRRNNQKVFKNMLEGNVSTVGEFFRKTATGR